MTVPGPTRVSSMPSFAVVMRFLRYGSAPACPTGFRLAHGRSCVAQIASAALSGALLAGAEVDDAGGAAGIGARRVDRVLLDLLGAGGRQGVDDVQPARSLVVGEPLVAVAEDGVGRLGGGDWAPEHDAGQHLLLAQLVLDGHDGRLGNVGVGQQDRLDLGGGDVLAGAADDVLLAVDEVQHAVWAARDDVAGVEPAAAPGRLGG